MFGYSPFRESVKSFAAQFREEGGEVVFRKDGKGAPIRVDAARRDAFIADFRRATWIATIGMVAGMVVLSVGIVWFAVRSNAEFSPIPIYVGCGAIFVAVMAWIAWAWRAPARALQFRASSGKALTRQEVETTFFEKLTYGQLAVAAGAMAVGLFSVSRKQDVLQGWGLLWLVFFGALFILVLVQTIRKWRFDARKRA